MRLLIVTQVVDKKDPLLGFFHTWLTAFAKEFEHIHVICLREGEYSLPANVSVHSLGKERSVVGPLSFAKGRVGVGTVSHSHTHSHGHIRAVSSHLWSRVHYTLKFYRYIWRYRHEYDCALVHMNPEYVVLAGPIWRLWGKRISLWYTHGTVTFGLRVATHFAHVVFTASKESFRIENAKVQVVGHGIATSSFVVPAAFHLQRSASLEGLRLFAIGRISRVKRQDIALEALAQLTAEGVNATLTLIGVPLTDADQSYQQSLHAFIEERGLQSRVVWRGAVMNSELPRALRDADILLHTSETGSLDKVVLEALASGVLLVTSSEAVRAVLPPALSTAAYAEQAAPALTRAITTLVARNDLADLRVEGRTWVEDQHALQALIGRILVTMGR